MTAVGAFAVENIDAFWPSIVRPLCRQYGSQQVWKTGLEVLNFPPNWLVSVREVELISSALKNKGEA